MKYHLFGLLCFLMFSHQTWAVCPGDLDESGTVEVADVLSMLSVFGCELDCGEADLDGDFAVGSSDVLLVLGFFGQSCDANGPSVWTNQPFEVLFEDNVVYGSGLSHDGWGGPVVDTISLELDVYAPDNDEEGRPALVIIHGGGVFWRAMNKKPLLICQMNTHRGAGSFSPSITDWRPNAARSAVLVERSPVFYQAPTRIKLLQCILQTETPRQHCVGWRVKLSSLALM